MTTPPHEILVGSAGLPADHWPGDGPPIVLLHAGVADRRSWWATAEAPTDVGDVLAYDRRGFGQSPPSASPYRHLDDLVSVLDQVAHGPAWLVGSSMGGQLAMDAALAHPEQVVGPSAAGAPGRGRYSGRYSGRHRGRHRGRYSGVGADRAGDGPSHGGLG